MEEAAKAIVERALLDPSLAVPKILPIVAVDDTDEICRGLVCFFYTHNLAVPLVRWAVRREVERVLRGGGENTLFRGNDFSIFLVADFFKTFGRDYLINTLKRPISDLIKFKGSLELRGQSGNSATLSRLLEHTSAVIGACFESADRCPMVFRQVLQSIQTTVAQQWPEQRYTPIATFIFLRFFCAATASPHLFGLARDVPSRDVQRNLVVVVRMMSALASGNPFREPYMLPCNKFIRENSEAMKTFLSDIATPPPIEPLESLPKPILTERTQEAALRMLTHHLFIHRRKIQLMRLTNETMRDHDNVFAPLFQALDTLEDAPPKPLLQELVIKQHSTTTPPEKSEKSGPFSSAFGKLKGKSSGTEMVVQTGLMLQLHEMEKERRALQFKYNELEEELKHTQAALHSSRKTNDKLSKGLRIAQRMAEMWQKRCEAETANTVRMMSAMSTSPADPASKEEEEEEKQEEDPLKPPSPPPELAALEMMPAPKEENLVPTMPKYQEEEEIIQQAAQFRTTRSRRGTVKISLGDKSPVPEGIANYATVAVSRNVVEKKKKEEEKEGTSSTISRGRAGTVYLRPSFG